MMLVWRYELRLLLRQRMALALLMMACILSAASVLAGIAEINQQRDVIARIQPQQAADQAAVAAWVSQKGDPGNAAYYTFHATWDQPSSLAFAALGQRDIAPYVLRIRALALESQIHESENYNAEMALPGRFDWAFVLTYLAPLIVIVLLHDFVSGEREAGRYALLSIMAHSPFALWGRRITMRIGLLFLALVTPFVLGALWSGTSLVLTAAVVGLALVYLLFWTVVVVSVASLRQGSVTNAATLAGIWFGLTLILPGLALLAINTAVPVRQGIELTLAQREAVHAGWDKPKQSTMQAFAGAYPEYRNTAPVQGGFHWKWYFAFQHLGDLSVSNQVKTYQSGLERRDRLTRWLARILPPVGLQVALHRWAATDLTAQLDYQASIRNYHEKLRQFYYPYIFDNKPFSRSDFTKAPHWEKH